tara:strand:+ start:31 stop:216 length:186 start_codon:yes stop_codon:yes gene_type:complete
MRSTLILVLKSLLILSVTLWATEVCTAGMENTKTKTKNNSKIATIILPNILKNFLIGSGFN